VAFVFARHWQQCVRDLTNTTRGLLRHKHEPKKTYKTSQSASTVGVGIALLSWSIDKHFTTNNASNELLKK